MTHAHVHGHHHHHDHGEAAFAAPGHDHRACARDVLARAERLCAERGARLTDMRRRVLEALADSHAPAGAYEVIERVTLEGERPPAPITVYRALDFLQEQGFVHRIESRNAFVACSRDHGTAASAPVVFLICEKCGAVGEASTEAFGAALTALAQGSGFSPRAPVIEISGECSHCRARRAAGEHDAA
ncbi:transcriptional repressor [Hansschlegelia quercus]|uniref:Transcriptional repressor n=1 Tax=Hansschlegelia quercus TaxID=2528245 RepID=A0A4Q9GMA3_9HYPH|nr:transcriptional repressor [Hansschlegelia quercus]TBN53834.1 transcriptional repressor [Hansschlegelia quercus]